MQALLIMGQNKQSSVTCDVFFICVTQLMFSTLEQLDHTHTQAHTDLNGLHPWSWTDSPMLWSCLLCPANKTIACHCQHVMRSVRGETLWKPHLRRWTDSVWVLDPSSAWLSTNTSRRQDERKRWLVLHVALPRLETQTWCYFWHVAAFPTSFFREMACVSIYTSSGGIAS